MRTTKVAASRRRRVKKAAPKRRHRRRSRKTAAAAPKRRRRKTRVRARVAHRKAATGHVMQAKRRRRVRRRRVSEAWRGNAAGHASAAKKGWRKRRRKAAAVAPKRRRRRRKVSEMVVQAPRRRRRKARRSHKRRRVHARRTSMVMARRHKRRHRRTYQARAPRGSGGKFGMIEMAAFAGLTFLGFAAADGLDRFLATYDPSGTTLPKDKFTSDGTGTLANTLNIASRPSWQRLAAGSALAVVPAIGASQFKMSALTRSSVNGFALGAGIKLFSTLWNNFVMPMLVPKGADATALRKSYVARLYPAEVAAHINLQNHMTAVSAVGAGVLSGAAADVGPFALGGDSPYPDAAQALRRGAGLQDQYPSLQNVMGTGGPGSDYPTVAQTMGVHAPAGHGMPGVPGVGWEPGPPSDVGPGPQAQPHKDPSCGCIGEKPNPYLGFIGEARTEETLFDTGVQQ